jgi:hypothetical protein
VRGDSRAKMKIRRTEAAGKLLRAAGGGRCDPSGDPNHTTGDEEGRERERDGREQRRARAL